MKPRGVLEGTGRSSASVVVLSLMAPVRRWAFSRFFPSSDAKSFERERFLLLHHEVDGSAELVGEDGKGFGLSMLFPELFDEFLGGRVCPQKENGGLGEGPLQVSVADLGSCESEFFPGGVLLALHEPGVGGEVLHAFEAVDIVDFVEQGQGENFSHSVNGAQAVEVVDVVDFGLLSEEKLEVSDESVIVSGELDVGGDAFGNGRVGEILGDALAIASVVDAGLGSGKIVLMVRVLDVGEEQASLAHQGEPAAQEIASGAHLGRVDIGLRKHASSKQGRDLERVDAVVLGLASVNGLHVQSVTEDEVDAPERKGPRANTK